MFIGKKTLEVVSSRSQQQTELDSFHFLDLESIKFISSSTAWSIMTQEDGSSAKTKLVNNIAEYNDYIDFLNNLEDFMAFFDSQNCCVSRNQMKNAYSNETLDRIFSLKPYPFETEIVRMGNLLYSPKATMNYAIPLNNNERILFHSENNELIFPTNHGDYQLLWNKSDDGRDMIESLFNLLYSYKKFASIIDQMCDDEKSEGYQDYFCYDQARDAMDGPDPRLIRCYRLLESLGYITTYNIVTDTGLPFLSQDQKSDYSIDLAIVDTSFFSKDALMKERLSILLSSTKEEAEKKQYFLTDSSNRQYLSYEKGCFGGHKKLKKYGMFNCPSALNAIRKGQYVKHRVFFADEDTALKAGYAPCGNCMKERYKMWKKGLLFN